MAEFMKGDRVVARRTMDGIAETREFEVASASRTFAFEEAFVADSHGRKHYFSDWEVERVEVDEADLPYWEFKLRYTLTGVFDIQGKNEEDALRRMKEIYYGFPPYYESMGEEDGPDPVVVSVRLSPEYSDD